MNYAIRFDNCWNGTRELFDKIIENSEKVVAYEHPPTDTKAVHIHALVWGWTKGEDTLRNHCKKMSVGGNYECKRKIRPREKNSPPVNESYIRYMSKGKYDPVYLKGFTDELIASEKALGYDKIDIQGGKLVIKKGDKGDGETPGRKTRKELVSGIVDDLGKDIYRADVSTICDVIRKHLIRNNEVIGMYKVIDLYDSVMMYGCPDKWLDMVSSKILSRNKV